MKSTGRIGLGMETQDKGQPEHQISHVASVPIVRKQLSAEKVDAPPALKKAGDAPASTAAPCRRCFRRVLEIV
jgi:hypothetical protein